VPEYRNPEEQRQSALRRARVQAAVDRAVANSTSLLAAMALGEPPEVVERWINALWDGLRDDLDPEDRLQAIVLLIESRSQAAAAKVIEVGRHV
jgi:hypothetical protein